MGAFDRPDSRWGAGHRGVDLLGAEDQQVRAAGAGVVTYAGLLAGRGVVAVSHGVLRTTYEPVAAAVDVGARVSTGTVLGTLTGNQSHCAPRVCLHWGAIRAGAYVNPLSLVTPSTPRLLPLGDAGAPVTLRGPAPSPGDPGRDAGPRTSAPATAVPVWRSAQADVAAVPGTGGEGHGDSDTSVDPAMRKLSAAVSTFAPPAAGALAGAIAAGVVVRLSRQSRGGGPSPPVPPPYWPPTSASRRDPGGGGVIDLATVRQRLRDAA
ncbi:M23 family metallopeptidase [Actinopolymorpha sp. B9G3]|uniref:M23 family metallopeptidase n=1 Tax=Actinopolymorpha sp. B9G3 TaxID=3158970 RepID=UPI0032D8E667